ncbi:MAG: putative Na+/H+ antiporter [Proteocatella sp.]
MNSFIEILLSEIQKNPFNIFSTIVFFFAIIHSFFTSKINALAHKLELEYYQKKVDKLVPPDSSCISAGILHFLGEIEAVFGIWAIVLGIGMSYFFDWETFVSYINSLHYTEPVLVIVIMTIASSRPILKMSELMIWKLVKMFSGSLESWWISILIIGPILGSFITQPASMVISAYLLSEKFYELNPPNRLKYGTLALLFVNTSIGGTLTNFAAPPVLIVAQKWGWDNMFMIKTFGIKSLLAIITSTFLYFILFKNDIKNLKNAYALNRFKNYIQRKFISKKELEYAFDDLEREINEKLGFTRDFSANCNIIKENIKIEAFKKFDSDETKKYAVDISIEERFEEIKISEMKRTIPGLLPIEEQPFYIDPHWDQREDKVPLWIMLVHTGFLILSLINAHEPILFISIFLFYLGFIQVTPFYQNRLDLKPPLMVAFFLSGLLVHCGLQNWWITPLLSDLSPLKLNIIATILTSFNDNAAITYLSSLVPNFSDSMKYAVLSGALTGGGLTVIANAPNPIGQSILKKYFKNGISASQLFKYALIPTVISSLYFIIPLILK